MQLLARAKPDRRRHAGGRWREVTVAKTGVRVDFLSCRRRVAPMAAGSTDCMVGRRSRRLRWGVAILAVGNVALFASFQAALPVGVWVHLD